MASSKKDKEIVPRNIQLKGIELLNVYFNHPKQSTADFNIFHFEIKIEHKTDIEKKTVITIIDIDTFNEPGDLKLGSITASCIFEIANMSDFADLGGNTISLPNEFIDTINRITISTARGMMFSQFRGTFLHHAFLPIVDVLSFNIKR